MRFFSKSQHKQVSARSEFGLCDDPSPAKNPAYLNETDNAKWIATVKNEQQREITFTAIDHCPEYEVVQADGTTAKRCDCALTADNQVVFVELKQQEYRGWIAAGEEQLRSTIAIFAQHDDSQEFGSKAAYISNSLRPTQKNNHQVRMNNFLNDTGYVLRIQSKVELS
ncbi:MAG: hypothetical protein LBT94_05600 [Prevotellaceae bacterium]|jgi:hypothetical protein|nr:hypothetical protein [Prevotellaceae bacterium]